MPDPIILDLYYISTIYTIYVLYLLLAGVGLNA